MNGISALEFLNRIMIIKSIELIFWFGLLSIASGYIEKKISFKVEIPAFI